MRQTEKQVPSAAPVRKARPSAAPVRKARPFAIPVRMRSLVLFTLVAALMCMMGQALLMGASWTGFKDSMTAFFENGLGGEGMQGIGIAIAVAGIVVAGISFAVHKFNPQSRMPGWITCLVIGLVGAIMMSGVSKPIEILKQFRDWVFGLFGV